MNCHGGFLQLLGMVVASLAGKSEKMCEGDKRWCDDPISYPHHITNLINSSHPVWSELSDQPQPQHKHHRKFFPLHIPATQPACETVDSFIVPRAAWNNQQQWRYILNSEDQNPRYKQVIKVGVCAENLIECHGHWPGHVTQCRQLYLEHKLVAITTEGEVLRDSFLFPSCCSCRILNLK